MKLSLEVFVIGTHIELAMGCVGPLLQNVS